MEEYNEEIVGEIQSIIELTKNILEKLQMEMPDVQDLSFLQNVTFYVDIFKIIFESEEFFEGDAKEQFENAEPGEQIQLLIDLLGQNILNMDLSDIKGQEIHQGNINHIKKFLEIILALSNIDQINTEEEIENIENPEMEKGQEIQNDKEIKKSKKSSIKSQKKQSNKKIEENQVENVQKLSQNFEKMEKQNSPILIQKNNQQMKNREQSLANTKKTKMKKQKTQSNIKTKKILQEKNEKMILEPKFLSKKQKKHGKVQQVKKIEKNLFPSSKTKQISQDQLKNIPEEVLMQYLPLSNRNKLGVNQQGDEQIQQTILRHQKQYHSVLNEFVRNLSKNQTNIYLKQNGLKSFISKNQRKLKSAQKQLEERLIREEKGYYLRMRDDIINYVKRLNQTIFEVKKREQIEQTKQINQKIKKRKEMTKEVIEGIEQYFKDQKDILKNQMKEQTQNQKILQKLERNKIEEMEREVMQDKKEKLEKLVQGWINERRKMKLQMNNEYELITKMNKMLNN